MDQKEFATEIVRTLTKENHCAYFAGGCVRDMLLGHEPKDYDVATSALPEQVMALFPRNVPVGVSFGVVRVLSDGDDPTQVEVATFRSESGYTDGRHPGKVEFSSAETDVKRRDFTINGMFFDPLKNSVIDMVGGQADLKARVIRAIGSPLDRFREDRLRMLRCVRFATRLGFAVDDATMASIKTEADTTSDISAERIRDELNLMLTGPNPRKAMEMLKETGLLRELLPEIDDMEGVRQPPQFHPEGDVWTHTLMLLGQLSNAPSSLAWAALLHDVGKPPTFTVSDRIRFNGHDQVGAEMAEKIMGRLKFSNEEIGRVVSMVRQHMAFMNLKDMRKASLKRFMRQPNFDELLDLHRIDCMASNGMLDSYDFCKAELAAMPPEVIKPLPLISGRDLIEMGMKPGPAFKDLLKDIEDAQLEGSIKTRDEALALVKSIVENKNAP